jgi:hypothetical protein
MSSTFSDHEPGPVWTYKSRLVTHHHHHLILHAPAALPIVSSPILPQRTPWLCRCAHAPPALSASRESAGTPTGVAPPADKKGPKSSSSSLSAVSPSSLGGPKRGFRRLLGAAAAQAAVGLSWCPSASARSCVCVACFAREMRPMLRMAVHDPRLAWRTGREGVASTGPLSLSGCKRQQRRPVLALVHALSRLALLGAPGAQGWLGNRVSVTGPTGHTHLAARSKQRLLRPLLSV